MAKGIAFKSETHVATNGAKVEVGTVTIGGRDFQATGSIVDEARGIVCAYVTGIPGAYRLTSWGGTEITSLRCTGTWDNVAVFGGFPVTMYAWSATINGRVYSGRNAGPCMFVRMRAGRSVRHGV